MIILDYRDLDKNYGPLSLSMTKLLDGVMLNVEVRLMKSLTDGIMK